MAPGRARAVFGTRGVQVLKTLDSRPRGNDRPGEFICGFPAIVLPDSVFQGAVLSFVIILPAPLVTLLIDIHTHSYPKSDDSFLSVDDLIEGSKAAGLDGICLTDHDAFWPYEQVRELSQRHDFLVLPGSEINTDGGHVLAFGLCRYEFGMHKPEFLRACADRDGGVLFAAHPYRRRFLEGPGRDPEARAGMLRRATEDPFFGLCEGLEALNGRGSLEQNRFSSDLRRDLEMPSVAGSDAHRPGQIGTAATEFFGRVECLVDLLNLLKAGEHRPVDLRGESSSTASPPLVRANP